MPSHSKLKFENCCGEMYSKAKACSWGMLHFSVCRYFLSVLAFLSILDWPRKCAEKYTLWLLCDTPPWLRFSKALCCTVHWCQWFLWCFWVTWPRSVDEWFPSLVVLHFVFPYLIQLIGLLVETSKPEMVVSYKRNKQMSNVEWVL